jgi:outer membrane immunogenic protein
MSRSLGIVLLLCGIVFAWPVFAADLPASTASPTEHIRDMWSGLYIGLNAGYGSSHLEAVGAGSANANGFAGGGQIGANWQSGALVLGVEGDFQGSAIKATNGLSPLVSLTDKIPYFATVRGRVGVATGDLLIFATGGAAYVDGEFTIAAGAMNSTTSVNKTTWTAGGGAEWMFAPQWSAKVEYLYVDTGSMDVTLPGGFATKGQATLHIARAGVNFHF